jgi:hypothetical protein
MDALPFSCKLIILQIYQVFDNDLLFRSRDIIVFAVESALFGWIEFLGLDGPAATVWLARCFSTLMISSACRPTLISVLAHEPKVATKAVLYRL